MNRIVLSLIVSSLITLSACGFQPVYRQSGVTTDLSERMRGVDVPVLRGNRTEQLFSVTLAELLDPQLSANSKPYALDLTFKRDEQPAIIQQNRQITRYRIALRVKYALRDRTTNKELTKGEAIIRTSYDDLTSEFANYSAQVDAEERAAKELAEQVRGRLIGYFSNHK